MKRTLLLLVALFGFGMAASPAEATWFYRRAYYAPAPVYYAPAPVYYRPYYAPVSYYAPPVVTYYAPPTVVYRPVTTFYYTPAPRVAFYYGW